MFILSGCGVDLLKLMLFIFFFECLISRYNCFGERNSKFYEEYEIEVYMGDDCGYKSNIGKDGRASNFHRRFVKHRK